MTAISTFATHLLASDGDIMSRTVVGARLAQLVLLALLAGLRADLAGQSGRTADTFDREYVLEATMLGYRGVGGEIDGVRNPVLWARRGETVRITMVNGELMVHDVVLEKLGIKSQQILDKGATTAITFTASESDTYYCSVPGHRQAGMEGRLDVTDEPRATSSGISPAANGRTLNLDFERGTLDDWTPAGDAFQLVGADGRTVARSGEPGPYSVSSAVGGSARKGTLSSVPFEVTHPYASFLVAGGAFSSTRVELVRAETGTPVFTISGADQRALRPAVADLSSVVGEDIFVRLVDDEEGAPTAVYLKENPWAHIAFDQFRFHDSKPFFVNELTTANMTLMPPVDPVKHSGLSAAAAAKAMTVPEGFAVTLAASEPDVVRPIAFAYDDRGRLWVAEAHTYPVRAPEGKGKDRILIFEDTNGDGTLDRRKVFMEDLNLVSAIEVGFGGVWVGAAPYLLFIPVVDGQDRPSGPPQVMLDGWGYQDTHEVLNTFTWGPDGWLYGAHGVFTRSNVGKPGASAAERQRLNAGIWRFHPTRHVFEVFAEGTSNPWGLDFNDYGHAFTTVCVIEHLYHVVQGARYKRQAGRHFNPHVYDDLKTVADHVHWVGNKGPHAGNGRSAAAGGGHAHVGAMIYLGGDDWPAEYRDSIFMNNIHGARANTDRLRRARSGYTATHGPDFLLANDSWSQMLNFRYGPDGSVHVIDWYDKNQCHSTNPDIHQKTLGRIFKIRHRNDRPVRVDLVKLSSERLVELQLHRNEWYVRHARRILQERGPDARVHAALKRILRENADVTRKLRALWALHVTEGLSERDLLELLGHENEYLRSWAVYLLVARKNPPEAALREFARMGRADASPLVRLYLASALQRVPVEKRWDVVESLLARDEDAEDQNLPLMVWYAAEPLVQVDMARALDAAIASRLTRVFAFTVQRIAAIGTQAALRVLAERLGATEDPARQEELLSGITSIVDKVPAKPELHTFKRLQLTDQFWSEGATAGDLNKDGVADIVSGPWWWEGPDFTRRHEYYPATATFQLTNGGTIATVPGFEGALGKENKYSDNFFAWVYDFNRDSWNDILIVGFPGTDTSWFENPKGADTHWRRNVVLGETDNESPVFADLTGDGKPELVCITKGRYGYAAPDPNDPTKPWTFHPLSPDNKYGKFTHGLGLGDVNGDGRLDLLEKNGWWEQPASLAGDPIWRFHAHPFGSGGAQMFAYDVNGDGLSDIITSLAAHGFGLAWFEQYSEDGATRFREHIIMNKEPGDNPYGVKFSELHAVDLVDMDGDGLRDFVTGKRFWSHGRTGDPDRNDSAVLYWFKLVRNGDGTVDFIPHRIDDDSGVGTQVVATDINGDSLPDIVTANKKGTFVHLHQKKSVTREEWEKAQPRRLPTASSPSTRRGNSEGQLAGASPMRAPH